jgi:hypothetical protein
MQQFNQQKLEFICFNNKKSKIQMAGEEADADAVSATNKGRYRLGY